MQQIHKKHIDTKVGVGILVVALAVGLPFTITSVMHQTNTQQHASGPEPTYPTQLYTNLNNATDIISTLNADGTMGPQSSYGNWSNSIPSFLKGKLVFAVTDPVQEGRPADPGSQGQQTNGVGNPNITHPVQPTQTLPTQAQGKGRSGNQQNNAQGGQNGPQTVAALNVTITKAEVHIAYLGTPGDQSQVGNPSPVPTGPVDHWETLNIDAPITVDLVALAKGTVAQTLGITDLASGRYTEIRLYVKSATAKLIDGTTIPLTLLGKDNIVKIVQPFAIEKGQTTKLTMDFDAQQSVISAGGQYLLKPVVARLLEEKQ